MMPGKNIGIEKNLKDFNAPILMKLGLRNLRIPLGPKSTEPSVDSQQGIPHPAQNFGTLLNSSVFAQMSGTTELLIH
jgi:hypothetical protein